MISHEFYVILSNLNPPIDPLRPYSCVYVTTVCVVLLNPKPNGAPTPGYRRNILSDPQGWPLNQAVGSMEVPLCLAVVRWALIWTWV